MTVLNYAAIAAVLAASTLLASAPAGASTARQYTFQGQGVYVTSKGLPENFIGGEASQAQSAYAHQPRDMEHHGRYFGGY